jgi:hypothetical protein
MCFKKKLGGGGCELTPAVVERIYETVPEGCILRRLCSVGLMDGLGGFGRSGQREDRVSGWVSGV